MNEETKVFDEITTEEVDTTIEAYEEESSGDGFAIIAVAVVTGITALGGWLLKKSGKLDEYRIKKLEKKGYVVSKPEPVEEDVEAEEVLDVEAE